MPNLAKALTQLAPVVETQIQLRNLAIPSVMGATAMITAITTQNSDALWKMP
jgi:hypothetical protein